MQKQDFETIKSKTLSRFWDPAKIFQDPRFSRYHSPPLICVVEQAWGFDGWVLAKFLFASSARETQWSSMTHNKSPTGVFHAWLFPQDTDPKRAV